MKRAALAVAHAAIFLAGFTAGAWLVQRSWACTATSPRSIKAPRPFPTVLVGERGPELVRLPPGSRIQLFPKP